MSLLIKKDTLLPPPPQHISRSLPAFWGCLFLVIILFFSNVARGEDITYGDGPPSLLDDPVVYFPGSTAANFIPQVGALFPKTSSSNNTVNFVNGDIYNPSPGSGRSGPAGNVYGGIGDPAQYGNVEYNKVSITGGQVYDVYGGLGAWVNVNNNKVDITNATVRNSVYGGRIVRGSGITANSNAVSIGSGATIYNNVYGVYSAVSGTFNNNSIEINGGEIRGSIISGAYAFISGVIVSNNSVTINDGTITQADIYGGRGQSGAGNPSTITNNTVTINGGEINLYSSNKGIYGGQNITGNGALVGSNNVIINDGKVNANIYGGYNTGNGSTELNTVTISDGTLTGNIYGGYSASGTATGNTVTIGGTATLGPGANLYGGYVGSGGGDAFTGNTLNKNNDANVFTARNFQSVNFGYDGYANIGALYTTPTGSAQSGVTLNTNTYTIDFGGVIEGTGSLTKTGSGGALILTGNNTYSGGTAVLSGTLEVRDTGALGGGNYSGNITVADAGTLIFDQAADQTLSGEISGTGSLIKKGQKTLFLNGYNENFTGLLDIAGGALKLGTGSYLGTGIMALGGGAIFDYSNATAYNASNFALQNLTVYGLGAEIRPNNTNVANVVSLSNSTLTFELPANIDIGDTMLYVTGKADITDSVVQINALGGIPNLSFGDRITLINTDDSLASNHDGTYAKNISGISKIYYLSTDPNNLFLTIQANEQAKAISEGRMAGLAFVFQGSDLILGPGMYAAMMETERKEAGLVPFFATSGDSLRYDTGSHIDIDGVHILSGLAWRAPLTGRRSLVTGAFFEAGWGSYDSYNSFNNLPSVKGNGNASYYGVGVLGRYEAPAESGGAYAEASLRTGYADTNFSSSDIFNGSSDVTKYDSGSIYFGVHAGVGYILKIYSQASFDLSTKYIWLHMNSDSVTVAGDAVKFRSADSRRWRTGGRLLYAVNRQITPYGGAYFDYEFGGKTKADASGIAIDAPELKGGTGQGELGLIIKPSPDMPLSVDLGIQGYVGVREGVTGSLRLNYEF